MKGLITWDRTIFDGEKRLLPNRNILYTQIYINEKKEGWSIVFKFKTPARDQGYRTIADEVTFLSEKAPHEILKESFKFDFMDGATKIGECILFKDEILEITDILDRIELLEQEKHDFKMHINSIRNNIFNATKEDLEKLVKYCVEYPYIFSIVININKEIALDYLSTIYLSKLNNVLEISSLPLFLFTIENTLGKKELNHFINTLPDKVKNNELFRKSLEELY